mmetsp:Transcript_81005/g.188184  ORF Transcript_81005/g.188184 Transcript_81005/m.188184 type:complete len:685 (-) Transcript_81005:84-2138(-)|eukprot:CAMPEP_0171063408 /NCGR_PEP_ID=MMETSP0766_2-20121228/5634_1 /TAXON_ID=439317 /ORGANISM="Gambierdiscus australes, Strain CAWD 149" /LENGTH=684 /DNA_ID=CAMNT_0011519305 /DNA_START=42 /DNA_END=2096 /DNA_ORIENTATION=-
MFFPDDFVWGVSTAAYQIEGGATGADGRGPGIWDAFAKVHQQKPQGASSGEVACDHYHLFEKDVCLLQSLGLRHYNFSVAWPRIQPTGRGPVNHAGLDFYGRLVDCLVNHGIEPIVTLYHWDLPLALQTELGGWTSPEVVSLFAAYAREVFSALSCRGVQRWVTLHEPWCTAVLGYGHGLHAPGEVNINQDPAVLFRVGHHLLLAHVEAVRVFRQELSLDQKGGVIGITLSADWAEPVPVPTSQRQNALNIEAAERVMDCSVGWFAGPIFQGEYPVVLQARRGEQMPRFTAEEAALLRHSVDFLCIHHRDVEHIEVPLSKEMESALSVRSCSPDSGAKPDASIWQTASVKLLKDPAKTPWALHKVLLWMQQHYQPKAGFFVVGPGFRSPDCCRERAVDDADRIQCLQDYIAAMHSAMSHGADVRGYFAWTLLDAFEWHDGYSVRAGLIHVDFATQQRTPKASAQWFSHVATHNSLSSCAGLRDDSRVTFAAHALQREGGDTAAPLDCTWTSTTGPCPDGSEDASLLAVALAGIDSARAVCVLYAVKNLLQDCKSARTGMPSGTPAPTEGLHHIAVQLAADIRGMRALATNAGSLWWVDAMKPRDDWDDVQPVTPHQSAVRWKWRKAIRKAAAWKAEQLRLLSGAGPRAAAQWSELTLISPATLAAAEWLCLSQQSEEARTKQLG